MRVGIVGLQHESNAFLAQPTVLRDFQNDLAEGKELRHHWQDAHHEVGGFLEGLGHAGIEAVPIFMARAMPGGIISTETSDHLLQAMMRAVSEAGPLDGVLAAPHGAAISATHRDLDGHWLGLLRRHLGPERPLICTLDPHANVSPAMIAACDATITYRSNPHLDQRQRGLEAAALMARTLAHEVSPVQRCVHPGLAINIERQLTDASPCRELYDRADRMLGLPGVLSNSIILGFPYGDVEEMGSGVIVVTDGDPALAGQLARELAGSMWDRRDEFVGQLVSVDDALADACRSTGPVCLLDMGDNVGGGSPGDGTLLAHAIHQRQIPRAFVCLYDPQSVAGAEAAGVGQTLHLVMGGKADLLHGPPLAAEVTVLSLHDGTFTESEPRHGGRTRFHMGSTAVVQTRHGMTIMLTSLRTPPSSLRQLTHCGIDPATFHLLVAKGVHAPVAAYRAVCPRFIRVNTPGVTTADMQSLAYQHRPRPLFPFESGRT